jgi:hypothetical protein
VSHPEGFDVHMWVRCEITEVRNLITDWHNTKRCVNSKNKLLGKKRSIVLMWWDYSLLAVWQVRYKVTKAKEWLH